MQCGESSRQSSNTVKIENLHELKVVTATKALSLFGYNGRRLMPRQQFMKDGYNLVPLTQMCHCMGCKQNNATHAELPGLGADAALLAASSGLAADESDVAWQAAGLMPARCMNLKQDLKGYRLQA